MMRSFKSQSKSNRAKVALPYFATFTAYIEFGEGVEAQVPNCVNIWTNGEWLVFTTDDGSVYNYRIDSVISYRKIKCEERDSA